MMTPSEFFQVLYRDVQGYAEIRMIHKTGDWSQVKRLYRPADTIHTGDFDVLAELNEDYHIYHRVNVSATQASKKADISHIVALYIDVDNPSDEALKRFQDMDYEPSMIVYSGGGFHGYWLLRQPLAIDSEATRNAVERTQEGLALAYGDDADLVAKDVTRILRTPGYYNIKDKYDPKPLCEVVYCDDDSYGRYRFEELHTRYAPLGTPQVAPKREIHPTAYQTELPRWVNEYIQNGAPTGERNNRLYAAARAFLDVGKTQFDAEQALMSRALSDGLTNSEASTAIASAFRASANPSVSYTMNARYAIGDTKKG